MPSIKEYDKKLNSLNNTAKMTGTMKLVSMSKLYRAHEAQKRAKNYAHKLTDMIQRLAASVESASHPLLKPRAQARKALILVISSDKGLCGSFNNSLIKGVRNWLVEQKKNYEKIDLSFCGKRGYMALKHAGEVCQNYEGISANPHFDGATKIGEDISRDFLSGKYDEIYLTYNIFNSPLSQHPTFKKLIPIEGETLVTGGTKLSADYLFEPPREELLDFLIPKYLYFRIYFALLENSAGEHGARMTAMENATKNANEMIDHYTLLRNRARQANITTELIEIVSGAEVLK